MWQHFIGHWCGIFYRNFDGVSRNFNQTSRLHMYSNNKLTYLFHQGPFQTKLIFKLLSFFSISATVVVALVATAGLTVVLPIKIDYSLKKNIYDNFNKYGEDDRLTEDINGVQKTVLHYCFTVPKYDFQLQWGFQFQCCGIEGYSDWLSTNYGKYPISCCINETSCINVKQIRKEQIYEPGCGSHLHDFFYSHFIYMVGGSVSLITIFVSVII